ncbi:hypothetical protein [uncultured Dokdonia sp.]|uniref:hypothetical protein n=1 Tax=uncultured Dokdonia sp. TaxID=575653 RepID=UPI0026293B8A|nr:hypothetical protein [uncultured Dokdonia sp.]
MKRILPLVHFLFIITFIFSCKNEDNSPEMMIPDEEEMEMLVLPEATQTGAGTFGALVDGEVFSEDTDPFLTIYTNVNGEFFFLTGALNLNSVVRQIRIGSVEAPIEENMTYEIGVGSNGNYFGEVTFNDSEDPITTANMSGALTITKLDPTTNIVSGTFFFNVMNGNTLVEITEGRFDQIYEE